MKALADHGELGDDPAGDGGDCEEVLAEFAKAGIDVDALAAQTSGRRRQVVRQVLERTDGGDRVQERRAQEGRVKCAGGAEAEWK